MNQTRREEVMDSKSHCFNDCVKCCWGYWMKGRPRSDYWVGWDKVVAELLLRWFQWSGWVYHQFGQELRETTK